MKSIKIYTDGACIGNPGPGGWAAIVIIADKTVELSGGERQTTNNRMELTAVIRALESIGGAKQNVTVYSDSQYVVNGIEKGWAKSWKKHFWRKSDGKPALNPDLWEKLLNLCEKHMVSFKWVRGHSGNPLNERCDQLAVAEAENQ